MAAAPADPAGPAVGAAPWALALLAVVAIVAFSNTLPGQFVYDDDEAIVRNPHVRALWPLTTAMGAPPQSAVAGRPLVSLSLALNHRLGGLAPAGYHLWNIAVHLGVALLLFGVLRRALRAARLSLNLRRDADAVAFATALLWLVHPLNSEVVAYTVLRTESMMAFYYLLAFYGALRGMPSERGNAPGWLAVSAGACLLGAACKEPIVTAPLMVWIYDAVFVSGSLVTAPRRRPWYYAGLTASWLLLAVLIAGGPRFRSAGFGSGVSSWTYLMNQGPMIGTYLRLAVWPDPLIADYGPTTTLPLGSVLPAVLFVAILAAVVAATWRRSAPLAYLGTWFFVTLAPASSVVPIATEVGAERRMYLPLMALIVLAVLAGRHVIGLATGPRRRAAVSVAVLAVVTAVFAAVTIGRNRVFHDRLRLWESVVEHRPHGRAHHNVAIELAARGRGDEAMAHYRLAAVDAPEAHYALGFELAQRGRPEEAIAELRQFIARKPGDAELPRAYNLLGFLLGQRGDSAGAVAAFRATLSMRPADADARGGLADGLSALGRLDEAERAYRAYLDVQPTDAAAHAALGAVLTAQDRLAEAVTAFARSAELAPQAAGARLNLGIALMAVERSDDAVRELMRGLDLEPSHVPLRNALAGALATRGQRAEAVAQFRRSLELEPGNAEALAGLAQLGARGATPGGPPP